MRSSAGTGNRPPQRYLGSWHDGDSGRVAPAHPEPAEARGQVRRAALQVSRTVSWTVLTGSTSRERLMIEDDLMKLARYQSNAGFGVVLATPDDTSPTPGHVRARQNVVLELGMLLTKLGRDRSPFY